MDLCMCGSQAGYPHDKLCPHPYYGGDIKQESAWMDAYREKKAALQKAIETEDPAINKAITGTASNCIGSNTDTV